MKTIENKLYKVTMVDDSCQWVKIESIKTDKELVFVFTTGDIKVRGKEIPKVPEPKVCRECGRELP